jgi:hypothetical protein
MDAKQKLDDWNGNWQKAIKRVKMMDTKQRSDYAEYLAAIYVK